MHIRKWYGRNITRVKRRDYFYANCVCYNIASRFWSITLPDTVTETSHYGHYRRTTHSRGPGWLTCCKVGSWSCSQLLYTPWFTRFSQRKLHCVWWRCLVDLTPNSRTASYKVEYWIHFTARFGGVHAFGYNFAESEPIWMKSAAL